tara:strand:+ start:3835 stop:4083 length:249 start_codon:yes stop_codon:yes gene_type:complete
MEMIQISEKLNAFEKDSQWFHENINSLRDKNLNGMYVAIKGGEIISTNKDIDVVIKEVKEQGENPAYIVIEFVYPKEIILRL